MDVVVLAPHTHTQDTGREVSLFWTFRCLFYYYFLFQTYVRVCYSTTNHSSISQFIEYDVHGDQHQQQQSYMEQYQPINGFFFLVW